MGKGFQKVFLFKWKKDPFFDSVEKVLMTYCGDELKDFHDELNDHLLRLEIKKVFHGLTNTKVYERLKKAAGSEQNKIRDVKSQFELAKKSHNFAGAIYSKGFQKVLSFKW